MQETGSSRGAADQAGVQVEEQVRNINLWQQTGFYVAGPAAALHATMRAEAAEPRSHAGGPGI